MSSQSGKNTGNVAGGLKATVNNPNVSDKAKHSARQRLESDEFEGLSESKDAGKNEGNVLGGYKATLKNPRVSGEAKEKAESVLKEHEM